MKNNINKIKIPLTFVLCSVIFAVFGITTAYAAGDASFMLTTTGTYAVGGTITVQITETSSSGDDVDAVQADIVYPDNLLSVSNVSTGTSDNSPFTLEGQDQTSSGQILLAYASTSVVSGTQNVASITFNVIAAGSTDTTPGDSNYFGMDDISVESVENSNIANSSGDSVFNGNYPAEMYTSASSGGSSTAGPTSESKSPSTPDTGMGLDSPSLWLITLGSAAFIVGLAIIYWRYKIAEVISSVLRR